MNERTTNRAARAGAALLAAATVLAGAGAGEARADVILEVSSNGLVGDERTAGEERRQTVYARPGRLLVVDRGARFASIIRTGGSGVVQEFDLSRRMYVQRDFSYYRQLREERVRQQQEAIRQANAMRGAQREDAEEVLRAQGLRLDGRIVVRVDRTNETKDIAGYRAEHVRVMQNDLVVFDLWVTRELEGLPSLLQIQREMGIFHEGVIAAAAGVEGFPLEMTARIDLASLAVREVHMIALALRTVDEMPDHFFERPASFQRVPEFPEEATLCPVCHVPIDPQEAEVLNFPGRGRIITCSHDCMIRYMEMQRPRESRPRGG